MKFKVPKGTELFDRLWEVQRKINEAKNAAIAFLKEKGFDSEKYYKKQYTLMGGIGAISFKEKPDGWVHVGSKWQSIFMPNSKNKKLLAEISGLPVVKYNELNDVLGFSQQMVSGGGGLMHVQAPATIWKDDFVLFEIPDECNYIPVDGAIEILSSEFKQLSE